MSGVLRYIDFSTQYLIASGNCALVTRKVEIFFSCSSRTSVLISGYMMGSPTRERAQCFGSLPSARRSGWTPGTPGKVRGQTLNNYRCSIIIRLFTCQAGTLKCNIEKLFLSILFPTCTLPVAFNV